MSSVLKYLEEDLREEARSRKREEAKGRDRYHLEEEKVISCI